MEEKKFLTALTAVIEKHDTSTPLDVSNVEELKSLRDAWTKDRSLFDSRLADASPGIALSVRIMARCCGVQV